MKRWKLAQNDQKVTLAWCIGSHCSQWAAVLWAGSTAGVREGKREPSGGGESVSEQYMGKSYTFVLKNNSDVSNTKQKRFTSSRFSTETALQMLHVQRVGEDDQVCDHERDSGGQIIFQLSSHLQTLFSLKLLNWCVTKTQMILDFISNLYTQHWN